MPGPRIRAEHRDPDPITAILAILGAVGSIASIVALVEQRRSEGANSQRRARDDLAQIIEHLANAEASLAELSSVASRLSLLAKASARNPRPSPIEPPEDGGPAFGQHGLSLYPKDLSVLFKLQDDAYRHGRSLQKALSSAFQVIYRSEALVRESDFQRLVNIVRGVNALLRRHESLQELLAGTVAICDAAAEAIHQIRQMLSEAGGISEQQ